LEVKNAESQGFDFSGFNRKLKIKLYPNYQLLLNMDQESAESSKTSSSSEPANEANLVHTTRKTTQELIQGLLKIWRT